MPYLPRFRRLMATALVFLGAAVPAVAGGADLLDQARSRHIAGDVDEALRLYLEAVEQLRREGNEADAAVCLNNASVILHGRGEHARSLELAGQAVELRRALGDDRSTGRSLTNAGRALRELGRFDEADEALSEALALAERVEDLRDQVVSLVNLGVLAQMEGRYGDALESIDEGLARVDASAGESWAPRQRLLLLNNRGALYERIGEFRRALADYRAIIDLVGEGAGSVPYRVNLATVLRNLGDPNRALDELRAAEGILIAGDADPAQHANLLSNVGLVLHRNLGRLEEAAAVLERAQGLARDSGDRLETMMVGNALGDLYVDQGRAAEAASMVREILDPSAGEVPLEGAWEAHRGMGRALLAAGDPDGALRALRTSVALIEGSRRNLVARFLSRRFLTDRFEVYALLAGALAEGGDIRGAMEVAQRARERLLLPRSPDGAPQDAGDEELRRLSALAARAYDGEEGAADEWHRLERAWSERSPVRLPDGVPPGEAWLVYVFGGGDARVLWRTADGAGYRRLPGGPDLTALAAAWLDALVQGEGNEMALGLDLYRAALAPVLEALPPGVGALRLVPDGPLWSVPLDALPRDGQGARVLDAFDVTVAPLLTAPRLDGVASGAPRCAFFGPPARMPAGLPGLPEAEAEAAALRQAVGGAGAEFLGADSSEANLRRVLAGPLGILHVATHAKVDAFDPGRTGIVLQPGAEGTRGDDGFLSLPEIAAQRMEVGLTVLSACSGAVGERLPGEGVESLATLLHEAGSSAVVASLWDVEDAPTRAFVEQFYHRLRRGQPVAVALREAKRALAASGGGLAAPRHWAGWIVIGDGGMRAVPPRWPWPWMLVLLLAVVTLLLLGRGLLRRSGSGVGDAEPPAVPS